jgi:hypothetical protein
MMTKDLQVAAGWQRELEDALGSRNPRVGWRRWQLVDGCRGGRRHRVHAPAGNAALAAREREIGGTFSDGYRALLRITDGLASRETAIHGHRDAYEVDNPHLPALLVAWDSDDHDDSMVVTSLTCDDDRVYRIDIHGRSEIPRPIATSFAEYARAFATVGRR